MAYLAVLTADGGVPVFTRSTANIKTKLPFAAVGALNGVHLFSRLRDAELKLAVTADEKIIWKEYLDRLVLILITRDDGCSDCHLYNLLDNIFASIVMLIGIDTLLNKGEIMRLQKSVVVSYPLVDYLLKQIDEEKYNMGDLTCSSDCILSSDTHCLQDTMSQFLNVADSLYGCLFIKGKTVISSKEWSTLTNQEKILISSYINCLPKEYSRELIIFLPTSSPKNPNRLVTLTLLQDVEVCVLCSSEPSLSFIIEESRKIWIESFGLLKVVANLHPRNIPIDIEIDKNILSLLLINTDKHQSVSCLQPFTINMGARLKNDPVLDLKGQEEALRTLYKLVAGTYLKNIELHNASSISSSEMHVLCQEPMFFDEDYFQAIEFYLYQDDYKCYVINETPYQLYILFNKKIPKYAIRPVAHRTLKLLTEYNLFPPS